MADKIDDGGPAFPQHQFVPTGGGAGHWHQAGGMTLRDWFAGQALAGWLASFTDTPSHPGEKPETAARTAAVSYALADAMLTERAKGGQ